MKRIVIAASVAVLATLGFAGAASAEPANASCFGQVHKAVNSGILDGIANVGDLVKEYGGQGKNTAAQGFC